MRWQRATVIRATLFDGAIPTMFFGLSLAALFLSHREVSWVALGRPFSWPGHSDKPGWDLVPHRPPLLGWTDRGQDIRCRDPRQAIRGSH